MSESVKTLSLVGVAVVLALAATFTRPRLNSSSPEVNSVGKTLFPDWKDAAAAKSLSITHVDETTNVLDKFVVADVDGRWVIPSHNGYPAIAEDHVFKVASKIIGLTVLAVMSDKASDQQTYGVVEPNEKTLTSTSSADFGRLIVVQDAAGKDLARLIVGNEDKSPAQNGPSNLRFVRRAGQDRIYRVSLDTEQLSTKFQDWVDTDILALKQHWDINSLLLRDYTIDKTIVRKDDIDLSFDDAKAAWSVKKLTEYKENEPQPTKLPADEELDSTKINDLKTNLSGLKLVDVTRKPAGFIEKLKKGADYLNDPEALQSLDDKAFIGVPHQHPTTLFSAGGDLTVGMKDGVEYTVRFGGTALSVKGDEKKAKGAAAPKDAKHASFERVAFITARFNPDLIPKPVIKPLPEVKKPDVKKSETTKPDATKPDTNKPEATKPEEKSPTTKTPDVKAPEKKPADETPSVPKTDGSSEKKSDAKAGGKPADPTKGSQANSHLSSELLALADTTDDVNKTDDAKKPDVPKTTGDKPAAADEKSPADTKPDVKKPPETKPADIKPADAKTTDEKPASEKPADKKPDDKPAADKKPEPAKPVAEKPKSDIDVAKEEEARDAERKEIETENRRNQDQYDETVKKGKAHAKELNNRFANWYYFISEDEYKKVHVGLSDIVKKKAGADSSPSPLPQSPFDKGGLNFPHP